jgi:hypothetical protein
MVTTAATIVTALKASWVDATYPIAEGKDWTDDAATNAWNLVQRVNVNQPTTNNKKMMSFRVWVENKVEAAIDALIVILQAMTGAVVYVQPLACYRNGDYYQAIIDIDIVD